MFIAAISILHGWDKYEGNPVLGPVMPWAWMALADPSLIALPEGGFYMVYTAAGLDTATGETLTRPGAAWSEDGFTWTMSDWTVITSGAPGSWDSAAVETPALVHDGDSILMYYAGERAHGGGQLAIGLAVSHDGGNSYERLGESPIITKDTSRWEEFRSIESPTVIRMGDSLIMWFNGQSLEWKVNVCRAASFDGVNWLRHHDNPVLQTGDPGDFDEWGVYAPCVRAVGDSLIMIYNGLMMGTSTYHFYSTFLGYAISTDKGVTWTKSPENPILGPGLPGDWDSTGPKTPTFDLRDGELIGCFWNGLDGRLGIFTHTMVSIEDNQPRPDFFAISAYPNPFNSSVTIALNDATVCHSRAQTGSHSVKNGNPEGFTVEIYDLAGRRVAVAEPVEAVEVPGEFAVPGATNAKLPSTGSGSVFVWQPDETLPSGVYLVRARFVPGGPSTGSGTVATKRVVFLK